MNRIIKPVLLGIVLNACAGPGAGGQPAPPADESLQRLNVYEIPTDQYGQEAPVMGPGWIQVSGTGSVQVDPDRASVTFAVETRGSTAGEASEANADAMDSVLRALRDAGFDGLELATHGYSLRPEYSNIPNQRVREVVAYVVNNNVRATISDVNAVGRVIDQAIASGANRVAGINFFASDTGPARAQAMALAVRTARAEAQVIAESLGYGLGEPLEVSGSASRPGPVPYQVEAMSMRAADTPIEAGDQTVTASVSIRFAIGLEGSG
ncbi:MAG: SIMPL domain-containing protein [Longimicrobiales bacterium]|jgi:uncharacterized protein YggE|nr:SIMPL domain-containing protein [Longimicrobiales bacterium]